MTKPVTDDPPVATGPDHEMTPGGTLKAPRRVGVIGAGLAGATAARQLHEQGVTVRLFDKARGPGGRSSTRRTDHASFDHGAQYFTVADDRVRTRVTAWQRAGVAQRWEGRIVEVSEAWRTEAVTRERWVGTPKMNSLIAHLLSGLDVRFRQRVARLAREGDGWLVTAEDGCTDGPFDHLVVALPSPQAAELLADVAPVFADRAASVRMLPCWALMLTLAESVGLPFDGAKVRGDGPIAWVACENSKPGRPDPTPEAWVVHAGNEWSQQHVELDKDEARDRLTAAFRELCATFGANSPSIVDAQAHRWLYARTDNALGEACLHDGQRGLTVCGDWLLGGKIEAALLSGAAAADRLPGVNA